MGENEAVCGRSDVAEHILEFRCEPPGRYEKAADDNRTPITGHQAMVHDKPHNTYQELQYTMVHGMHSRQNL